MRVKKTNIVFVVIYVDIYHISYKIMYLIASFMIFASCGWVAVCGCVVENEVVCEAMEASGNSGFIFSCSST